MAAPFWRSRCDHIIESLKSTERCSKRPTDQPSNSINQWQVELQASKFLPIDVCGAIRSKDVLKFVLVLEKVAATTDDLLSVIVERASCFAGNTILHIAAKFGSENILELIADHFPQLITRRNIKGDTVLHVAAKTHNSLLIKIVIQCYARHSANSFSTHNNEDLLTRMRNEYGNTALHEAVIASNVDGAELLFTVDEVVTYFLNKEGKSPLYLAVETGNDKIVDILLQTQLPNMEMHQGNSPLHAAILAKISGQRIKSIFFSQPLLEGWLLDRESEHTTPRIDEQIPPEVSYQIKKMIEKRRDLINWRDQKGGTPLHCAASVGYLDGVRIIVRESPLSTLEWNKKGQLPIHIAQRKEARESLK